MHFKDSSRETKWKIIQMGSKGDLDEVTPEEWGKIVEFEVFMNVEFLFETRNV